MPTICKKCVLPEAPPGIVFDELGVCSLCRAHERLEAKQPGRPPLETDFIKLLDRKKGKGAYDCLVMCSGGKDSTAALYYMARRYKMRILAFMFEHGFETLEARANVERAVEILGVDFLFFKSSYLMPMFKRLLETGSNAVICHPCSIWYMDLAFDLAARFRIPFIVAGWTKGQSTDQDAMSKGGCSLHSPEFAAMGRATQEFLDGALKDLPQYRTFPRTMEEVLKRARKKFKSTVVSPHWFLPFDQETYVELIKKELGWEQIEFSYPKGSTNCTLNFISVHNSMRDFGYTHYHVEASKLIRAGVLTREKALRDLAIDFDKETLNRIAKKLDYRFD
mgnify:CR=1 FL=1